MGKTHWVDAARGSDAGDGSKARPWATLETAAAAVAPGDTVMVMPGDYRGPLVIETPCTTWRNAADGSLAWRLVSALPFLARWVRRPEVVIHVPPGTTYWVHVRANGVQLIGFTVRVEDVWTA